MLNKHVFFLQVCIVNFRDVLVKEPYQYLLKEFSMEKLAFLKDLHRQEMIDELYPYDDVFVE